MKNFIYIIFCFYTISVYGFQGFEHSAHELSGRFPFLKNHLDLFQARVQDDLENNHLESEYRTLFAPFLSYAETGSSPLISEPKFMDDEFSNLTIAAEDALHKIAAEVVVNDQAVNCWNVDFCRSNSAKRILAVWQDERRGVNNPDIYGQFYDLDFKAIGANFRVHAESGNFAQINPAVCVLSNGGFAVVWEDYRNSRATLYARVFGSDGKAVTEEFIVSTDQKAQLKPDIAADGLNRFIVTWLQNDDGDYNVVACLFNNNGTTASSVFRINDDQQTFQWFPSVTSTSTGESLVVWEDKRDGNSNIYGQRLRADGSKRAANFKIDDGVGTAIQWRPQVAWGQNRFVVVWEDYRNVTGSIYAQSLDGGLIKEDVNFRIDSIQQTGIKEWPVIALNAQDEFAVSWQTEMEENREVFAAQWDAQKRSVAQIKLTAAQTGDYYSLPRIDLVQKVSTLFYLRIKAGETVQNVVTAQISWMNVPVELSFFTAESQGNTVHLRWRTESESNNYGFWLQRKTNTSDYVDLVFIPGHGTSIDSHEYGYDDQIGQGRFIYRLKQVDFDGATEYSHVVEVNSQLPASSVLLVNYPNPFNGETVIVFSLVEPCDCSLVVENIAGQVVRTLYAGAMDEGEHQIVWDGKDDQSRTVASGLYRCRLQNQRVHSSIRMTVLK
ncbi:MAG: hypothetical protein EHM72_07305 [Calditrichaeota bacterium]|nr:MAG: hypothetical protein EHM72_07305 [Calditrichota bacterium]